MPTEERTAFAFTGGGSLGAVQVGMLRETLAAGVRPDFVIGASVGALNAAYFAGAPTTEGVESLAAIWLRLKRVDVFPIGLINALGLLRHPDNIVSPAALRRLIISNLQYAEIESAKIPLHVVATDLQGATVPLSRGPAIEAILASAAIPGVFPMVRIDARPLMDGAIGHRSAVRIAADLGATRIIVFNTGYACALAQPPKGAVAHALHALTLLVSWRLMNDIATLPESVHIHVAPSLCPLNVSPFNFSASAELIERAAASTRAWIAGGGLRRRSRPQELAPHHH